MDVRLCRVPAALPGAEGRSRRQEIPAAEIQIVLDREGDGGGEPAIGLLQSHGQQCRKGQNAQCPTRVIEVSTIEGKLQAPFQRLVPLVVPGEVTRRTDICQRVNEGLRLPELLGEGDGPIAPLERSLEIVVEHPQLGEVAVGHGELRPGTQRLEHIQCAAVAASAASPRASRGARASGDSLPP